MRFSATAQQVLISRSMSTNKSKHTESDSVDDDATPPEVEIVETLETVEEEVVPEFEVLDETADEAVEQADEAPAEDDKSDAKKDEKKSE